MFLCQAFIQFSHLQYSAHSICVTANSNTDSRVFVIVYSICYNQFKYYFQVLSQQIPILYTISVIINSDTVFQLFSKWSLWKSREGLRRIIKLCEGFYFIIRWRRSNVAMAMFRWLHGSMAWQCLETTDVFDFCHNQLAILYSILQQSILIRSLFLVTTRSLVFHVLTYQSRSHAWCPFLSVPMCLDKTG